MVLLCFVLLCFLPSNPPHHAHIPLEHWCDAPKSSETGTYGVNSEPCSQVPFPCGGLTKSINLQDYVRLACHMSANQLMFADLLMLDTKHIQKSELPTFHCQPLGLSFCVGLWVVISLWYDSSATSIVLHLRGVEWQQDSFLYPVTSL